MLIDIFIMYSIFNFFLFFIGLTNTIRLTDETRLILMILSALVFFWLAASSFSIQSTFCTYTSSWICTTQTTTELPLAVFDVGFGLLCLMYVAMSVMGVLGKSVNAGREM
jgi:hypothetical protein